MTLCFKNETQYRKWLGELPPKTQLRLATSEGRAVQAPSPDPKTPPVRPPAIALRWRPSADLRRALWVWTGALVVISAGCLALWYR